MDFCGWWSTSCGTGGIYSGARLGSAAARQAGGRRPTTGASDDIWCTIGTRGKWDYSRGNGIDSLLDRFTDPYWIEYRRKGCKTHHLWGELHTAWNNLFGLGNPHGSLVWFTYNPPPHPGQRTPHSSSWKQAGEAAFLLWLWFWDLFITLSNRCTELSLALWSLSCLQRNNSKLN